MRERGLPNIYWTLEEQEDEEAPGAIGGIKVRTRLDIAGSTSLRVVRKGRYNQFVYVKIIGEGRMLTIVFAYIPHRASKITHA